VDTHCYDAARSVPLTILAKKTYNSVSLAIRDYTAGMIAECVILNIIDPPLRLTLNALQSSLYVQ
jgi:hypothetical protein